MRFILRLATLACLTNSPAQARPILAWPVDCTLGDTCHLQSYVDVDPTDGAVDHTCGPLSYDGHKGTDIALTSRAVMEAGVAVRAAAPGRVTATRDGMDDRLFADDTDLQGQDCGNGVVIDHADGWQTQYCHLARGSVTVRPGQAVDTGDRLGAIGLSGRTQFPHLHLSVRHAGRTVDPFAPDAEPSDCGPPHPGAGLWADPKPVYRPGGLIAAGFAAGVPDYDEIKAGAAGTPDLPADSPALVLWAHAFAARAGDRITLRITGPDGKTAFDTDIPLDRAQAQLFRAAGKRLSTPLDIGLWHGTATLRRDDGVIDSRTVTLTVRP